MNRWVWVVLAVILFQANDITLRLLSTTTNFAAASAIQAVPLAVVCGIIVWKSQRLRRINKSKGSLRLVVLYGSLQFLVGNALYFTAMRHGGLSIASPTVQSQAIWAVIIGMFLLREKVSVRMWLGISMFAVGIAALTYFKSAGIEMQNGWIFGVAVGLLAGLCWASAAAAQKKLLNDGVDLVYILFLGTVAGILLLIIFGFTALGLSFASEFTNPDTYKMLITGMFSGGAIWCISKALRQIPISRVIPVLSINIIFNTITGYIFFGEFISTGTFVSMLTAVLGIILVNVPIKLATRQKIINEE